MAQQPPPANSIFTLKGRVVDDATGEPMAYATVAIVQFPMIEQIIKGCVTDEKGRFELKVKKGEFDLIVRSLGYKIASKSLTPDMEDVIDFGTMRMTVKAEELGVVTVKPLVEISVDEVKYDLTQDPDRETSTLHAILQKVPLMRMTPMGDIYVDSPDKTFVVVRNGKVDALFSGKLNDVLKSLPAKGFTSVTVMRAPPQRYGDVDYLVNIEADPNARLFGVIGFTAGKADGSSGETEIGQSAIGSLDKFRFTFGGMFKNTNAPTVKQRMEQVQYKDAALLIQSERTEKTGENESMGGTFSYDLAKNQFISWGIWYGQEDSRERKSQDIVNNAEQSIGTFLKRSHRENWNVKVDYQYDFKKPQRVLNVAYLFKSTPSRSNDGGVLAEQNRPRLSTENDSYEHTVQAHYYDPITRALILETGMGYIRRNYLSENHYRVEQASDIWIEEDERYQEMNKLNHIVNGYAQLTYRKKRFSINGGIKADYLYDGDGTKLQTGDSVQFISEKGFSFSPEIRIAYRFPKTTLSDLSLFYRVLRRRPNLKQLSPYADYSNPNLVVVGNPNLKQTTLHNVALGISFGRLSINPSWVYSNSIASSVWYKDDEGRIVRTFENSGLFNSIGLGVNYSINKHGFSGHIMANSSYTYTKKQRDERNESWNVAISVNAGYTFKNQLSIGLNGGIVKNFDSGSNGLDLPLGTVSLQIKKKLFKDRMEIELATSDLLHLNWKTEQWVKTADFSMRQEFETRAIPLNLKASFRIGSFKVKPLHKARRSAKIDDVAPDE